MSGIKLVAHIQEGAWKGHGADGTARDESVRTTLACSNNSEGKSLGLPHPLGIKEHQGCLWFALVDAPSAVLLGLDYLKAAEASVTFDGFLMFDSGHCVPFIDSRSLLGRVPWLCLGEKLCVKVVLPWLCRELVTTSVATSKYLHVFVCVVVVCFYLSSLIFILSQIVKHRAVHRSDRPKGAES